MTIRKDICHFECQPAFHNLTIMLWNIELLTEEILNHQLSTQAVLIVLLGGEASLEMDNRSRRMDRAAAYYCPAGGTFGVHSHGRGPLSALVMYFSMYEGSSTAISKEVDSINRIEDTSTRPQ